MSSSIFVVKRNKVDGGYRDDGKNKSLGFVGDYSAVEYVLHEVGLMADVGDTVFYPKHKKGLPLDTLEIGKKYYKETAIRRIKLAGLKSELKSCNNDDDIWELSSKAYPILWGNYKLSMSQDNPTNDEQYFLMTDERRHSLFDNFEMWSEDKDEDDIEAVKEFLDELKNVIDNVDFEKENLYYSVA